MCFPESRTLTEIENILESFSDKTGTVYKCLQTLSTSSFDLDRAETTYQLKDEFIEKANIFNGFFSLMEQNERINVLLHPTAHS